MTRPTPRLSATLALSGLAAALLLAAPAVTGEELSFDDVRSQTRQFIGYERSIKLNAAQEAIKKEALTKIPAPCCNDNSIYTCCCPCNMALTVWGLSHYLIAEQGYGAEQVRRKVEEWIELINPNGFSGDVCYVAGGCMRPFAANGCGGMRRDRVVF